MEYALAQGIHSFNCESEAELALIDALAARLGVQARAAVRVNPDVDAATHPYIATGLREHKFGIDIADAAAVYERARALRTCGHGRRELPYRLANPRLRTDARGARPYARAGRATCASRAIAIRSLDLGGGLGVPYRPGEDAPAIAGFAAEVRRRMRDHRSVPHARARTLHRGRGGYAAHARPLPQVRGLEAIRHRGRGHERPHPARALPVPSRDSAGAESTPGPGSSPMWSARSARAAISSLATARWPTCLPGDLLALATTGAYCFVAASNYNSRPRCAEVLVDGDKLARHSHP